MFLYFNQLDKNLPNIVMLSINNDFNIKLDFTRNFIFGKNQNTLIFKSDQILDIAIN